MKTKLIILTAVAAVVLYACSDRDEEVRQEAIEKVKASNQEKFKLNSPSQYSRDAEPQAIKDSIIIRNSNSTGVGTTTDPDNGSEVIDPTKPDKPW